MIPVHNESAFRIGQRVTIVQKVPEAKSWNDKWNDAMMDSTLGKDGAVISATPTGGFQVKLDNSREAYWYPSCALAPGAGAVLKVKKASGPRRVRVTDGPWNAAPCPHLRWHLMGFFREKLILERTGFTYTNANGVSVGGSKVAEVTVECPKCSKKMFLKAADLATAK